MRLFVARCATHWVLHEGNTAARVLFGGYAGTFFTAARFASFISVSASPDTTASAVQAQQRFDKQLLDAKQYCRTSRSCVGVCKPQTG
jgi:hypothetical protein